MAVTGLVEQESHQVVAVVMPNLVNRVIGGNIFPFFMFRIKNINKASFSSVFKIIRAIEILFDTKII